MIAADQPIDHRRRHGGAQGATYQHGPVEQSRAQGRLNQSADKKNDEETGILYLLIRPRPAVSPNQS